MSAVLKFDPVDFIQTQTRVDSSPFVPEIKLHLASEVTPLWQMTEDKMQAGQVPPPFWAFAWAGGLGVARYLLDHPETVRGKRVVDLACGGGICGIAAMRAGATHCWGIDIDPFALAALPLNAALNHVEVEPVAGIAMNEPPTNIDLIIAGDICYQQAMAAKLLRWLYLCVASGTRVILGDPGRAYVPASGLSELACYTVPVLRDLEDQDHLTVRVWDLGLPEEVH